MASDDVKPPKQDSESPTSESSALRSKVKAQLLKVCTTSPLSKEVLFKPDSKESTNKRTERIAEVCKEVEQALFATFGAVDKGYKAAFRNISRALKDALSPATTVPVKAQDIESMSDPNVAPGANVVSSLDISIVELLDGTDTADAAVMRTVDTLPVGLKPASMQQEKADGQKAKKPKAKQKKKPRNKKKKPSSEQTLEAESKDPGETKGNEKPKRRDREQQVAKYTKSKEPLVLEPDDIESHVRALVSARDNTTKAVADPQSWYQLGLAEENAFRATKAMAHCMAALKAYQQASRCGWAGYAPLLNRKGNLHRIAAEYDSALECWDTVIRMSTASESKSDSEPQKALPSEDKIPKHMRLTKSDKIKYANMASEARNSVLRLLDTMHKLVNSKASMSAKAVDKICTALRNNGITLDDHERSALSGLSEGDKPNETKYLKCTGVAVLPIPSIPPSMGMADEPFNMLVVDEEGSFFILSMYNICVDLHSASLLDRANMEIARPKLDPIVVHKGGQELRIPQVMLQDPAKITAKGLAFQPSWVAFPLQMHVAILKQRQRSL